MPLIPSSYTRAPFYQPNGHWQTIWPALFRKVNTFTWSRERLELEDGDFLDLDWLPAPDSRRLVVLSHGLEGNSDRHYVRGMARAFRQNGWEALAWNCRSCSGELNRTARLYHHGDVEDIGHVLAHALRQKDYESVVLIGFSMGGAITSKYLGVQGTQLPSPIRAGIAFSTPCDLRAGAEALELPGNAFYKKRFFRKLQAKLLAKEQQFPGLIDPSLFAQVQRWSDFDEWFSAPVAGYRNANEFYEHSSCVNFMAGSIVPLLIVNAQNDPILLPACTPVELSEKYDHIFVEMPLTGGHVGFQSRGPVIWSEQRALDFVAQYVHH